MATGLHESWGPLRSGGLIARALRDRCPSSASLGAVARELRLGHREDVDAEVAREAAEDLPRHARVAQQRHEDAQREGGAEQRRVGLAAGDAGRNGVHAREQRGEERGAERDRQRVVRAAAEAGDRHARHREGDEPAVGELHREGIRARGECRRVPAKGDDARAEDRLRQQRRDAVDAGVRKRHRPRMRDVAKRREERAQDPDGEKELVRLREERHVHRCSDDGDRDRAEVDEGAGGEGRRPPLRACECGPEEHAAREQDAVDGGVEVAEVERAGAELLEEREEERRVDGHAVEECLRGGEAEGDARREVDKRGEEGVAPVVEQLAERRPAAGAARLLAVDGVEGLVREERHGGVRPHPVRERKAREREVGEDDTRRRGHDEARERERVGRDGLGDALGDRGPVALHEVLGAQAKVGATVLVVLESLEVGRRQLVRVGRRALAE
mmetsp:Transcript_1206/g.3954  ORF Transcript_1206/g.3954 Transcript_1206/m.3954 type:complete len:444 (-) Transcript_1206:84-1415(-)